MEIYLYRTRTRQDTTDGVLCAENGQRICDTAERTQMRLPAGCYDVGFRKHKGRRMPYLTPKPQSTPQNQMASAVIAPGNGVYGKDFGSTIIVGDHLVPGVVINSGMYFDKLFKRIEMALARKQKVEITIKN